MAIRRDAHPEGGGSHCCPHCKKNTISPLYRLRVGISHPLESNRNIRLRSGLGHKINQLGRIFLFTCRDDCVRTVPPGFDKRFYRSRISGAGSHDPLGRNSSSKQLWKRRFRRPTAARRGWHSANFQIPLFRMVGMKQQTKQVMQACAFLTLPCAHMLATLGTPVALPLLDDPKSCPYCSLFTYTTLCVLAAGLRALTPTTHGANLVCTPTGVQRPSQLERADFF